MKKKFSSRHFRSEMAYVGALVCMIGAIIIFAFLVVAPASSSGLEKRLFARIATQTSAEFLGFNEDEVDCWRLATPEGGSIEGYAVLSAESKKWEIIPFEPQPPTGPTQ